MVSRIFEGETDLPRSARNQLEGRRRPRAVSDPMNAADMAAVVSYALYIVIPKKIAARERIYDCGSSGVTCDYQTWNPASLVTLRKAG